MTENQLRKKVVDTAVSYLGCNEANGSHKKIINLYNSHKPLARGYAVKYTDEWCATFVSAIAIKCGLTDIMPTECGCERMIDLYKKLGSWKESDAYVPDEGDVIFYDWDDSGAGDNKGGSDHVGIVAKVSGSTIKVIEGNKGEAVAYRTIAVNGRYIRGYGVPKYAKKATTKDDGKESAAAKKPEKEKSTTYTKKQFVKDVQKAIGAEVDGIVGPETLSKLVTISKSKNTRHAAVKPVQKRLNALGYNCGTADGIAGPKFDSAVKKFQKAKGCVVDGELTAGAKTWKKLLEV